MINRIKTMLCRVLSQSFTIDLNGRRVILPYVAGLQTHVTEPWMNELLKQVLDVKKGCFWDVGVNLGQTLLKVKTLDPERDYIGFEPNPTCTSYALHVAELNGFTGCSIIPVALTHRSGLGVLYSIQDSSHDSAATIIDGFRDDDGHQIARRQFVPFYDFEDGVELLGASAENVGVIKIDVEGAELDVVRALFSLIQDKQPFIVVEMLPTNQEGSERYNRQCELVHDLQSIGYVLYRIQHSANEPVRIVEYQDVEVYSDVELSDYLIVPKEAVVDITRMTKKEV